MKLGDRLRDPRTLYLGALGAIGSLYVLIVWLLPVLPGQDLPQHLAYARILADHSDESLPFAASYEIAPRFQTYFTIHYVLAFLAKLGSVDTAIRVVFTVYVVGTLAAFHHLCRVFHPEGDVPWAGLLGSLFVWNPIVMMGFLSFAVGVPVFLLAAASTVRWVRGERGAAVVALSAAGALGAVHAFAAGCIVLFALLAGAWLARGRGRLACVAVGAAAVGAFAACSAFGEAGLGGFGDASFEEASRAAHGLEAIGIALELRFSDTLTSASYLLWSVVGPFRMAVCAVVLAALAVTVGVCWRARADVASDPATHRLRQLTIAFLLVGWVAPWGVAVPTEMTFIDLRLLALGAMLVVAALAAPRFFGSALPRLALTVFCVGFAVHFGARAAQFADESRDVLELVAAVDAEQRMTSVVFHDRSEGFGKQFRITHFLPMYYTVEHAGLTSQFWGRYTHHLPVGHAGGRRPTHAADWAPQTFRPSHLADAEWVLVQYADVDDDPAADVRASARVRDMLPTVTDEVACRGLWCVYRVPAETRARARRGSLDGRVRRSARPSPARHSQQPS